MPDDVDDDTADADVGHPRHALLSTQSNSCCLSLTDHTLRSNSLCNGRVKHTVCLKKPDPGEITGLQGAPLVLWLSVFSYFSGGRLFLRLKVLMTPANIAVKSSLLFSRPSSECIIY